MSLVGYTVQNPALRWRYLKQLLFFGVVRLCVIIIAVSLGGILLYIFINGIGVVSLDFLTEAPRDSMTAGGIMPAILGTFYLTLGAIGIALPLGVTSAVYLSEYAKQGPLVRVIRIGINCLAGVPSIEVADDPEGGSAQRLAGYPDGFHPRNRACGGGDGPHHVYGRGLFHGKAAPVRLRRGHGLAISHLRAGDGGDAHRPDKAYSVWNSPGASGARSRRGFDRYCGAELCEEKKAVVMA